MPLSVRSEIKPRLLNGLGSFVLPCSKITLRYCNWGGSSEGMRQLLFKELKQVVQKYPKIHFEIVKRHGHPIIKGEYVGGLDKVICVRNYSPQHIKQKIAYLAENSGKPQAKYPGAVTSFRPSIRGIWSPFHVEKEFRYKI